MRRTYLYRLDVTYPEVTPGVYWEPPGWEAICLDKGWVDYASGETRPFQWPARRLYLSKTAAERRVELLERYGAKVTVARSLPVEWPEAGQ